MTTNKLLIIGLTLGMCLILIVLTNWGCMGFSGKGFIASYNPIIWAGLCFVVAAIHSFNAPSFAISISGACLMVLLPWVISVVVGCIIRGEDDFVTLIGFAALFLLIPGMISYFLGVGFGRLVVRFAR